MPWQHLGMHQYKKEDDQPKYEYQANWADMSYKFVSQKKLYWLPREGGYILLYSNKSKGIHAFHP
jgi:hypothetical protein